MLCYTLFDLWMLPLDFPWLIYPISTSLDFPTLVLPLQTLDFALSPIVAVVFTFVVAEAHQTWKSTVSSSLVAHSGLQSRPELILCWLKHTNQAFRFKQSFLCRQLE